MRNRWAVLAVVFVTRISMAFQFQSIASVGPLLVRDFGWSYSQLGWLIGLYMLPGVAFALPGGLLGQRFGDRRVVLIGLALMVLGGLVTARSDGFALAATSRLVSGIGAVLMNILLAKMVAEWFAGQELSTGMGIMLTAWPIGLGVAASTLGTIAVRWSWRAAIDATALVAAIGLVLILTLYREPPGRSNDAAAPIAARFRLPPRDLALSVSAGAAWGCFNAAFIALLSFGPALLVARGVEIGAAGRAISLAVWMTFVSVPLGGYLNDRLRRPDLVIVAGSVVTGLVMLALPLVDHVALAFAVIGVVSGGPAGAIMALLPPALRPERLATGFGVYYTVFYLAMALGQPLAGFIRDTTESPASPVIFAAVVMSATAVGLAVFRKIEARSS